MNALRSGLSAALVFVALLVVAAAGARPNVFTVRITSGPANPTTSTSATFVFSASEGGVAFTCKLDTQIASSCVSPKSYGSLALGAHRFTVTGTRRAERASDARSWTIVANKPPSASFTSSPSAPKAGEEVIFKSTSTDSDGRIVNFEWDLDGDGSFGEEGEPAGGNATVATRAFPKPGPYTIQLRVTDDRRAQATARQVVAVASVPLPKGLHVVQALRKVRIRGPFVFTRRDLGRLKGVRDYRPREVDDDPLPKPTGRPAPCREVFCDPPGLTTEVVSRLLTPPLQTSNTWCTRCIDPQIAASKGSLVVGMRNVVWYMDKSFNKLTLGRVPIESVPLCTLFKPMIADINAHLNLPENQEDAEKHKITVQNGYGINCDKETGGTQPANWKYDRDNDPATPDVFYWPSDGFFDARVLWDDDLGRFVIGALVKNENTTKYWTKTECDSTKGKVIPGCKDADVAKARRSILALAVSKSGDPRDGWYEYWTWAYPGQDKCKDGECPAAGAVDYLSMGLSRKYITMEATVGDSKIAEGSAEHSRREITIIDKAATLAFSPQNRETIGYQNAQPLREPPFDGAGNAAGRKLAADAASTPGPILQPAVQHVPKDVPCDCFFFATLWRNPDSGIPEPDPKDPPNGKYNVLLWVFSPGPGSQYRLYEQAVPIRMFRAVKGVAPQKAAPSVLRRPGQSSPTLNFVANGVNKLVFRNGSFYLTFDECLGWNEQKEACDLSAIRFIRIVLHGVVTKQGVPTQLNADVAVDWTFGRRNTLDPPGKTAWYGFPSVEANRNGDAALVYHRSAAWLYPEARYSVYFLKGKDIRPSRVLKAGEFTLGSPSKWAGGSHHYLGMSVDPFDGTAIWMINGYSVSSEGGGSWRYAIGKVLGAPFPDLSWHGVSAAPAGRNDGQYAIKARIGNLGDGAARATRIRLALSKDKKPGGDVAVKSIAVPHLGSGHNRMVSLRITITPRLRAMGYRYLLLMLDARKKLKEYGEGNNTAYIKLP